MILAAATLFAATEVLFPAADTKPEGHDGAAVRAENAAVVVDVAPGHKFSGVNFVFPAQARSTCGRTAP